MSVDDIAIAEQFAEQLRDRITDLTLHEQADVIEAVLAEVENMRAGVMATFEDLNEQAALAGEDPP